MCGCGGCWRRAQTALSLAATSRDAVLDDAARAAATFVAGWKTHSYARLACGKRSRTRHTRTLCECRPDGVRALDDAHTRSLSARGARQSISARHCVAAAAGQLRACRAHTRPEREWIQSILKQADRAEDPHGASCVQGLDDSRQMQIALLFAIRYALHRRESRVIRCQQLFCCCVWRTARTHTHARTAHRGTLSDRRLGSGETRKCRVSVRALDDGRHDVRSRRPRHTRACTTHARTPRGGRQHRMDG